LQYLVPFLLVVDELNFIDFTLTFLRRKKSKQKSSRNGCEVGTLPTAFAPVGLSLKTTKLATLRQCRFFNAPSLLTVNAVDATKKAKR